MMNKLTIKTIINSMFGTLLLLPTLLVTAAEHNHNHNHFNPALEVLGNDIISLTVCYNNGYLSDQDQEPAFKNLIDHAGVEGEELGMYYMNSLGAKAEEIMASEQGKILWNETFCNELTVVYLDVDKLQEKKKHDLEHGHDHEHDHGHEYGQDTLSADVIQEDVERGRLLRVN